MMPTGGPESSPKLTSAALWEADILNAMPETCDQPSRPPQALIRMAWSRSLRMCALARLGLMFLVAGRSLLSSSATGFQHTGNMFVCSGNSSVISISDTNGSIVAVTSDLRPARLKGEPKEQGAIPPTRAEGACRRANLGPTAPRSDSSQTDFQLRTRGQAKRQTPPATIGPHGLGRIDAVQHLLPDPP